MWIPGRIWAPSWVIFRTDSDYIGWAPVPPGYSVGIRTIDMGGPSNFVFVSSHDFLTPRVRTSIITGDRVNIIIKNTTVVNNITIQNNVVVNRGPDASFVQRATGHVLRAERIERVERVAPFERVDRAQLAFNPKEKAKHGLRVVEKVPASRALPGSDNRAAGERNTSPARASNPRKGGPGNHPVTQRPATRPEPARRPTDSRQESRPAPAPPREPVARPTHEAKGKAEPPQDAKAQPDSKGKSDAKQSERAKPKGKAAPRESAKKDNPDKKGQGSDKKADSEAKDGAHH